jgi:hypothetical protein
MYAVWVTQEQQQNNPGEDKYAESVELSDSLGKSQKKQDLDTSSF